MVLISGELRAGFILLVLGGFFSLHGMVMSRVQSHWQKRRELAKNCPKGYKVL